MERIARVGKGRVLKFIATFNFLIHLYQSIVDINMAKSIVSLTLLLISVILNFKNGYGALTSGSNPQSVKIMAELGIKISYLLYIGIGLIVIGILTLFPKTFLIGNILSAMSIVCIMALAINAGNYGMALLEIPFLLLPLLLIFLKYPFLK